MFERAGPGEEELRKTHSLMQSLKDEFNFQEDKIKIIINEYKLSKITPVEQAEILGRNIFATLPKIEARLGLKATIPKSGDVILSVLRGI